MASYDISNYNQDGLCFDTGEIFKHKRTKSGSLRVWMNVSNEGKLLYLDRNGVPYYETVDEETLFDEGSLDTLWGIPVTYGTHPTDSNGNYYKLDDTTSKGESVGMTMQSVFPERNPARLNLLSVVYDREAIEGIESGVNQVSLSYDRDLKFDGGNIFQRNRYYNHLTILDQGRDSKTKVYYGSNYDSLMRPIIYDVAGNVVSMSDILGASVPTPKTNDIIKSKSSIIATII